MASSPRLEVRMKELCGLTPPEFSEHGLGVSLNDLNFYAEVLPLCDSTA